MLVTHCSQIGTTAKTLLSVSRSLKNVEIGFDKDVSDHLKNRNQRI